MLGARTRDSLAPLALMFAIVVATLLLYGIAHAGPLVAVTPTGIDLSWQAWMLVVFAGAGGALKILDVLIAGLRWLAPRTETKLDDKARDDLKIVRDDIAWVVQMLGALVPATGVPTGVADKPAAPTLVKVSGSGTAAMLVVLLLGAAGAGLMTGCTKAELGAAATSAEHAVVNCTGQAIGTTPALDLATLVAVANTVANERAKCTPAGGSLDWKCVEADAVGAGKVLGGCTIVALLTGSSPTSTARLAAAAAPDPGRVALDHFRARVAPGSTFHAATGDY